ncbi:MAG TPA: cell envelope integrity protein CreD [Caulobacteraceae bacterium]|jgi:inner membrane protein
MADATSTAGAPAIPGAKPAGRSADWGAKAILVFALAVLMAIPGVLVFSLVAERQHRAESVSADVSTLQGGSQQLLGPMLIAPYVAPKPPTKDANGVLQPQDPDTGWYVVSPDQGTANVVLKTTTLHRSLFNVPVYEAQAEFDAKFSPPPTSPNLPAGATVNWQAARVVVGFSDLRGAKSEVTGVFTDAAGHSALAFSPTSGIALGAPADSGGHPAASFGLVAAPAGALTAGQGGNLHVSMRFTGAKRVSVMPFAKSTVVKIAGDWPGPSFDGAFSPEGRTTGGHAFSVNWSVPFIARGLSDHGPAEALSLDQLGAKDLGVTLISQIDPYESVGRALKYAVMFVGLVFLTFFVFEALSGMRVHPAQYLLVGLAQMVFYMLLLSLSETVGFDLAFAGAATATVTLMGFYAGAAFRSRARGVQALAIFSVVYGLSYFLMRLDDFALLAGSIASFVGLAGAMYLTRNLDWYGGKAEPKGSAGTPVAAA